MLKLHFTGYGAAYYPPFGNTAAWFVSEGRFWLIDCGEDVFGKIYDLPQYRDAKEILVLLTHMHGDHVGSLGSLISYTQHFLAKRVRLLYPDAEIRSYLGLSGIREEEYEHVDGGQLREGFTCGKITVRSVPVFHDPSMGCYGYEISDGEETVYYSGDSRTVGEEVLTQLRQGRFSRLYLDTGKNGAVNSGHGNFEALKERVLKQWRSRVICMHLDCDFRKEIEEEGFGGCWQERL